MQGATFYTIYQQIRAYGEKTAFVLPMRTVSYTQFAEDICRVAKCLPDGHWNILLDVRDKYHFSAAYFAAILTGNTALLLPSAASDRTYYQNFRDVFRLTDNFVEDAFARSGSKLCPQSAAETATILFSSGTTAEPKAVALSEENILWDLKGGIERFGYSDDRILSVLPFTHVFGLVCDLLAPLWCGCTLAFAEGLPEFFQKMPDFRPTVLHLTPGIVSLLCAKLNAAGDRNAVVGDRLCRIMSGAANTSTELCSRLKQYGLNLYGCYGLTECTCGVCLCSGKSDRPGSAGKPLLCNRVDIDECGRIFVVGKNVMQGYVDRQGELYGRTNGVFETGDLGYFDADGFLYISGRADDLIVFSDGKKLMPQWAEQMLNGIPGVIESVVYASGRESICAVICVETLAQAEEIKAAVGAFVFDGHKIRSMEIMTDSLKKTRFGKLDRRYYAGKSS